MSEALALALGRELDLIEVSPHAAPPVTKILDFGKYRYQQEKAQREANKKIKKVTIKGIRLSVRIGTHDLTVKAKQADEFLTAGHKINAEVRMRGREQAHANLAFDLLRKFQGSLTVPTTIEAGPKRMGPIVSLLLAPGK